MSTEPQPEIQDRLLQVERILADLDDLTRGLAPQALSFRPAPGRWSMADCLAHLNAMGAWYLKQIDRSLAEARARGLVPAGPFRPSPLERWLVSLTEPPVRRLRVRAPAPFGPGRGADPAEIVADFRSLQEALRGRLLQAGAVDLKRARARSPFSRRLRLSLGACFAHLLAHERRHLWQARQVRQDPGFPA